MCMVLLKGAKSNLTSYIQAIVTGKLCKRGHIIRVVGKIMSLLCNALCSLQDAVIVGSLKRDAIIKKALKFEFVSNTCICGHLRVSTYTCDTA